MNRNVLALLVLVVSLGAAVWLLWGRDYVKGKQRRDLADELATWVVKEAVAGGTGSLLILAPVAEARDPFPRQLGDRLQGRAKSAGFAPVELVRVPYNTAMEGSGEPVTREAFLGLLQQHAQAKTVISLVGVPRLTDKDLPAEGRPRLIVASTILMPYLSKLPRGLLDFAIEVKRNSATDTSVDPALGELGHYFKLVRPASP